MAEASFLDHLQEEIAAWQRQGVIGAGQARRILDYYSLATPEADEARSEGRLATILGVLGALLVGIGVILFVASNWERVDRPFQLLLLLSALIGTYALGYWLKYARRDHPRIGTAFVFLGSLVFGANVFFVAQTYQVRAEEPLLLLFWALGVLPMAYATASRPSLYLAILAALRWYPFQLNAWRVYTFGPDASIGWAALLPYGVLIASLGELQRTFKKTLSFAGAYLVLGLVAAFLMLLYLSFADTWRGFGGSRATIQGSLDAALLPL